MTGESNIGETPEAFLNKLAQSLSDSEGADQELVTILKIHLLKIAPAADALSQAKVAIYKLASNRANPPKVETTDG